MLLSTLCNFLFNEIGLVYKFESKPILCFALITFAINANLELDDG